MIDLPWPPTVNQLHTVAKGRKVLSRGGRLYRWIVHEAIRKAKVEPFGQARLEVSIEAFMPDRRKRDLDNVLKAALDGLTKAGLWDDDSQIDALSIRRAPTIAGFLRMTISPSPPELTGAQHSTASPP